MFLAQVVLAVAGEQRAIRVVVVAGAALASQLGASAFRVRRTRRRQLGQVERLGGGLGAGSSASLSASVSR